MLDRLENTDQYDSLHALRSEELAAHKTVTVAKTVALAVIALLTTLLSPWPGPVYIYGILVVFVLLGWVSWLVARASWGRAWHQYVFVFADFSLLTFTLLFPNPLIPFEYPPQFAFRYGPFIYFFVLLAGLAYVFQPRLVLWGGVSAAVCWAVGVLWMISLSDTIWVQDGEVGVDTALHYAAQPTFVDIDVRIQEIAVFLIAAGLLALAVRRSRKIALRQAKLAREKENLGRYFPEKTAQLLAERTDPFSVPKEHSAAVLFADLVAFTSWSETHSPSETIDLLREVHGVLAQTVFRHHGTLDKFIGDGLMATFGTPEPTGQDASNALSAMVDMRDAFQNWQKERADGQGAGLKLAIGAHYGPVVIGNIGSSERLEFAVLGDTVNVASRLEGATRLVGCDALASSSLVEAALSENAAECSRVHGQLQHYGKIALRGRHEPVDVYTL